MCVVHRGVIVGVCVLIGRRPVGGRSAASRRLVFDRRRRTRRSAAGRRLVVDRRRRASLRSAAGRRLVGGWSAAGTGGRWRSFLVGAGVPLVGLRWGRFSVGWDFGRGGSVFLVVFLNVRFFVFFTFVSFGVWGDPSLGFVGVRGSGPVGLGRVVGGPSRRVSAGFRGMGTVGLVHVVGGPSRSVSAGFRGSGTVGLKRVASCPSLGVSAGVRGSGSVVLG